MLIACEVGNYGRVVGIYKKLGYIGFRHGLARSVKINFKKLGSAILGFINRVKIGVFDELAVEILRGSIIGIDK